MDTLQLIEYFKTHRGAFRRSNRETAKRTHSFLDDVIAARDILKQGRLLKVTHTPASQPTFPKILVFDIETAPMKAYVWKMWKENISIEKLIDDWFIICWSAKWLYSTEMLGDCLTPEEMINEDDSRVVKSLWDLFNEADIVIAHNGGKFDVPKANSRFVINNLTPPSPYRIVDTLQIAKRQFGFASNKLDALATYLGIPNKLDTDFELWRRCMEGDKDALDYMFKYNQQDVKILEDVYLKLLPWIKNHPNIGVYLNELCCANCGSDDVELVEGQYYYTQVGKYPIYKCKHCGAYTRGRKTVKMNKLITTSTSR